MLEFVNVRLASDFVVDGLSTCKRVSRWGTHAKLAGFNELQIPSVASKAGISIAL